LNTFVTGGQARGCQSKQQELTGAAVDAAHKVHERTVAEAKR
jgi:hypothetical protein